jgi:hypothetical protein
MTAAVIAADLPVGSVVATPTIAWIMVHPGSDGPWRSTSQFGGSVNDERVQLELDLGRATVLRYGTGHAPTEGGAT